MKTCFVNKCNLESFGFKSERIVLNKTTNNIKLFFNVWYVRACFNWQRTVSLPFPRMAKVSIVGM